MSEEDINLTHELSLKLKTQPGWDHLHHKDIGAALVLLKQNHKGDEQEAARAGTYAKGLAQEPDTRIGCANEAL